MGYLPIEYDVTNRAAAVLGADSHALAKVERLRELGARVTLFACGASLELARVRLGEQGVELRCETPDDAALAGFAVVFASPAAEVDLVRLGAWAREHGRLFCALDRPEHGTFINPAAAEVSGVGVRFTTAGVCPGLASKLRDAVAAGLADPRLALLIVDLSDRRAGLARASSDDSGASERTQGMREALRGFEAEIRLAFPAVPKPSGEC